MNQEHEDETQPRDLTPPCRCYIIPRNEPCPVHLHDRSQTTERTLGVGQRVINTTTSLKR